MKQLPEVFTKPFDSNKVESSLYSLWEESGFFNPDNLPGKRDETYTIILPPPNVTGTLHTGHAIMLAIQDILIRYKRMRGYKTLWLPGTDHAAIATQSVVEKKIQKEEGLNRHTLGREELLKRVQAFALESQNTILSQFRSMGASLDWSRLAFTLDDTRNFAVRTMFKKMYDDGLIYRGQRIVNWDPKGQTTISDDEIVNEERKAVLYTFKYSKDFPIEISSTRPETKVGDVAVAVHPDDERYKAYVGKTYEVLFAGCSITIQIIADTAVEKDFGTGALGVTPSHSQIDWEIKERHNLPVKQVINEYAKMYGLQNEELNGKKVGEAREYIVNWLRENNLLSSVS
jgi:valyl-tRNA synthetase